MHKINKFILFLDAAERFSFYGLQAIVVLFLKEELNFTNTNVTSVIHFLLFITYLMPLLSGMIIDTFNLNIYKYITFINIMYCIGHVVIYFGDSSKTIFLIGYLIITLFAGLLKPIMLAIGSSYSKNIAENDKFIQIYYIFVNIGSFVSYMLIPLLYINYGYKKAFTLSGIAMFIGTLVFLKTKKYFNINRFKGSDSMILIFKNFIQYKIKFKNEKKSHELIINHYKEQGMIEHLDVINFFKQFIKLLCFAIIFFMIYEQKQSIIMLQAPKLEKFLCFSAIQMQAVNPIIVIFGSGLIYKFIYLRYKSFDFYKRIFTSLAFILIGILVMLKVQNMINANKSVSSLMHLFILSCFTIGEILIYPSLLNIAYAKLEPKHKALAGSMLFLTIAFANLFNSLIFKLIDGGRYTTETIIFMSILLFFNIILYYKKILKNKVLNFN